MIKVEFHYNDCNKITGFYISGHAGYSEEGSDIICAAVSALATNTVNSIEALTDDEFEAECDETGSLKLNVITLSSFSELLLNSLQIGIKSIIADYGSDYINII